MTGNPTFINPFHFVPPTKPLSASPMSDVKKTLRQKEDPPVPEMLHDRYLATSELDNGPTPDGFFSGRIVCKLTTQTPCVFGNQHLVVDGVPEIKEKEKRTTTSTRVDNLSIDGHAAIAGTTLKGMLSTIAEMASGSTMRVLNNRVLSIRSTMHRSRSAIGMVLGEMGCRKLLPLSLPTFKPKADSTQFTPTDDTDNSVWEAILEQAQKLGLDLSGIYVKEGSDAKERYLPKFTVRALPAQSKAAIQWPKDGSGPDSSMPEAVLKRLKRNEANKVILIRPAKHKPLAVLQDVDEEQKDSQIWGVVRTLEEPQKFSVFLPVPQCWCREYECKKDGIKEHRIDFSLLWANLNKKEVSPMAAEEACATFDSIVARYESNAPSPPKRSCTSLSGQAFMLPERHGIGKTLCQGDLVFFRPANATTVESVAISSIWREAPRWMWDPETHEEDLVRSDGQPEQVDHHPMHAKRTIVTLAEKMFGWVDDVSRRRDDKHRPEAAPVPCYKGRVRVSDAMSPSKLADVQLLSDVSDGDLPSELHGYYPLKILSSPKPPCPELYLRRTRGHSDGTIRDKFPSEDDIVIQGWKFYVLESTAVGDDKCQAWQTKHIKDAVNQKSWVRPIQHGTDFWFHIDFENLTATELQLLCYSVRPTEDFVHRCGFGKPLQLGGVKLQPMAIQLIDRLGRYRNDLGLLKPPARYIGGNDQAELPGNDEQEQLPRLLQRRGYPDQMNGSAKLVSKLAGEFQTQMEQVTEGRHQIMALVGQPVVLPADCLGVSYPRTAGQDGESETFHWFTENRQTHPPRCQFLRPITPSQATVPALKVIYRIIVDHKLKSHKAIMNGITGAKPPVGFELRVHKSTYENRNKWERDTSIDLAIGFSGKENFHAPQLPNPGEVASVVEWVRDQCEQKARTLVKDQQDQART